MKLLQRVSLSVLVIAFAAPTQAELLKPTEIAILAAKDSRQSQSIAQYYAQKRGVPTSQICVVDLPKGEVLQRSIWDTKIRPAIRRWIATNRLQNKIRCFVTVLDVPLKIGKQESFDTTTKRRQRLLNLERKRRIERLLNFLGQFDEIAKSSAAPEAAEDANLGANLNSSSTLKEVTELLGERLKAAEARITPMSDGQPKQEAIQKLTQLSVAAAGLNVVLQNMQRTITAGNATERITAEFQFGRGRLTGLSEGQALMEGLPATPERDTNLIALIERVGGIAGSVTWIDGQLKLLDDNETHSSFDSELSLVMESEYPLLRWLPNYLHYNYDGSPLREITRTLMVARLDAPTYELTRSLIDSAIAVEEKGLTGTVYLDARGVGKLDGSNPGAGSIEDYDKSLLMAAKMLKENTDLQVVLNNTPDLFAEGACPNAALYCGWYSLSKYIDSFEWVPGAVGYHMASGEAATLHNPESQVWCKRMLDGGVAATIGPVYEPYLLAFPRPNEFLALLTSGRFSYIECIYRTQATNSWTMTTIGDPLYNPFKVKPALRNPPETYQRVFGVE